MSSSTLSSDRCPHNIEEIDPLTPPSIRYFRKFSQSIELFGICTVTFLAAALIYAMTLRPAIELFSLTSAVILSWGLWLKKTPNPWINLKTVGLGTAALYGLKLMGTFAGSALSILMLFSPFIMIFSNSIQSNMVSNERYALSHASSQSIIRVILLSTFIIPLVVAGPSIFFSRLFSHILPGIFNLSMFFGGSYLLGKLCAFGIKKNHESKLCPEALAAYQMNRVANKLEQVQDLLLDYSEKKTS